MATFFQKRMLLKGLLSGETAYTGPFHAMIDVTRRCNLRCVGCRFHSPVVHRSSAADPGVQDMSWDVFENLCRQLQAAGTRVLFLMGSGEPLLHPDIFRMITMAKELGLHVTVISNGTLVDEAAANRLITAGTDVLQVSLWALTEEDYAEQYPGTDPQIFYRVLQGLHRLGLEKRRRDVTLPRVILHHPVNRRNMHSIEAIADLASQVGCHGISLSPFLSLQGRNRELLPSGEEEQQLGIRLRALMHSLRRRGLTENIATVLERYAFVPLRRKTSACYAGWFHARVRVDGTFVPCGTCDIALGRAGSQPFAEVWNGPAYRRFRRRARTYKGLLDLSAKEGDCNYCCYTRDNMRIERCVGGWLTLWLRLRARFTHGDGDTPGCGDSGRDGCERPQ
jgi:MoaA/NifB/PqqE/SkfB family radical SAM enzyme